MLNSFRDPLVRRPLLQARSFSWKLRASPKPKKLLEDDPNLTMGWIPSKHKRGPSTSRPGLLAIKVRFDLAHSPHRASGPGISSSSPP